MWMQVAQGVGGFLAARRRAKVQRQWDEYHNDMTNLQAAQSTNAVIANEAKIEEEAVLAQVALDISKLKTVARIENQAAASGVAGGSVAATILGVSRNAGRREASLDRQRESALLVTRSQKHQIATQAKLGQRELTDGPNLLSHVLNTGINILNEHESGTKSNGTTLDGATPIGNPFDRLRRGLEDTFSGFTSLTE